MRSFTRFINFLFFACITSTVCAQAQETQPIEKTYTCDVSKDEPFRKICTDRSAKTYLLENFFQEVPLSKELSDVVCDWNLPITPKGVFSQGPNYGVVCQNQNMTHRVLIGWDGNSRLRLTMQQLGNMQLVLRGKGEESHQSCKESHIHKSIKNALTSGSCVATITTGDEKGLKISSTIVFLEPEKSSKRRFFVKVMNITKPTSTEDTESYALKALTN
jgi:hypothetical protein